MYNLAPVSHLTPNSYRKGIQLWAFIALRPSLYKRLTSFQMRILGWIGRRRGRFTSVPMAKGWTKYRDLPAPEGKTFQKQWSERSS